MPFNIFFTVFFFACLILIIKTKFVCYFIILLLKICNTCCNGWIQEEKRFWRKAESSSEQYYFQEEMNHLNSVTSARFVAAEERSYPFTDGDYLKESLVKICVRYTECHFRHLCEHEKICIKSPVSVWNHILVWAGFFYHELHQK